MPHDVFFEIGVRELLSRREELAAETLRADGSTLGSLIHMGAAMAEEVEFDGQAEDEAGYLDTARGDALSRYAASEYGEEKHGTTAAQAPVVFSRTGAGPEVTILSGCVLKTATGVRFTLDTNIFYPLGDLTSKASTATCTIVGPDGNVGLGEINTIETSLGDPNITVTNDEVASGGNLEESDEAFVARLRDAIARRIRGTPPAVRLGAMQVPSVREAAVFEWLDTAGVPNGSGTLVIADESGHGNAALVDAVSQELREWRPLGSFVTIVAGQPVYESISVLAVWKTGFATLANRNGLRDAIVARVNRLDPRASSGEPEETCKLTVSVVQEVRPLIIGLEALFVVIPVGTVVPDFGYMIRTRNDLVTVS